MSGMNPSLIEALKAGQFGFARQPQKSCKIQFGILSGPVALCMDNWLSFFSTSSTVIVNLAGVGDAGC